jgi:hypothetical protein
MPLWVYMYEVIVVLLIAIGVMGEKKLALPRLQRAGQIALPVILFFTTTLLIVSVWAQPEGMLLASPFGFPAVSGRYYVALLPFLLLFLPQGRPTLKLRPHTIITLITGLLIFASYGLAYTYFSTPGTILQKVFIKL